MRALRSRAPMHLAAAAALALAATACAIEEPLELEPRAQWTPVEAEDVVVHRDGEALSWNFGTVRLGDRVVAGLEVTNVGSAPMTVRPPRLEAPFSSDVPAAGLAVGVGETRRIELGFAPRDEDGFAWTGSLGIVDYPGRDVQLRLEGVGQAPRFSCDADALSFGTVPKGRAETRTVTCRNDADVAGVLQIGAIAGQAADQFVHAWTGRNEVTLAPGAAQAIEVTYRATREGPAAASLDLFSRLDERLDRIAHVRLEGTALDRVVSCEPAVVDFGFVRPGARAGAELRCRNLGSAPFHLTAAALDTSSDAGFTVEAGALPLELPAAVGDTPGEAGVGLGFAPGPTDAARKNGLLLVSTDDPGTPRIDVLLTGFAGGPELSCAPTAIDFGVVAANTPALRSFVCSNVGTDDPSRRDDALSITALEPTDPAEFRAEVRGGLAPDGYAVGATFTVDVTYAPVDDGLDAAAIRLPSNAVNATAAAPYEVSVAGDGRDLPACEFEVVPRELRFGLVDKGRTATREFAIRNHLPDAECLIRNLRLAPACDPEFSLPAGEVQLEVLPPQAEVRYPVAFAPREYREAGFACDVLFDISDPGEPHRALHVTGASRSPCALIAPNDLDFGVVEPGCATLDREFQIINTCGTPLTIGEVGVAEGASAEFFVRAFPPAGTVVSPGGSAIFSMAYRAVDEGTDLGAAFVFVDGVDEPYSAMLRGEGAFGAVQTDRFAQNDRPKVDLLWVIDNSGSMGEEQIAIARNLRPFLSFAEAQEIDYRIAVTSASLAVGGSGCFGGVQGGEDGRFFPVDNSRPRILTPTTPNLATIWPLNVTLGTCGGTSNPESPLEAALRALSPPLSDHCDDPRHPEGNDGNCGFLRPDAHLSVIAMTDEPDQSPNNVNYYANALQALKGFRNRHLFNFHAITGDKDTGCNGPGGSAAAGNEVIAMVESTEGGVFQSICASDWEASLREMSAAAFGFKTCFPLTNEPADRNQNGYISDTEGEVQVRMNGHVVASRGDQGQTVWSYRRNQVSICFEPLAVPEPGTQLEVRYQVACHGL